MSRSPVIIDTHVVVAGLLTANDASPVALILDDIMAARLPLVVSETLPAEYSTVLLRRSLRKLHGLTISEVEAILTDLAQHAIVLNPVKGAAPQAPDPGDQFLWDLLAARVDLLLVTGDKPLLQDRGMQGRVISPRMFVADAEASR